MVIVVAILLVVLQDVNANNCSPFLEMYFYWDNFQRASHIKTLHRTLVIMVHGVIKINFYTDAVKTL